MAIRGAAVAIAAVLFVTACAAEGGPPEVAWDEGLLAQDDREAQTLSTPVEAADEGTEEPRFRSAIRRVKKAEVRHSWRRGCPVGWRKLRHLTVSHWGFGGNVRQGELIVRRAQAKRVVRAMRKLFRAGYPIKRMELIDVYRGDDDASMAANNTSAFNCRRVAGSSRWSEHAYGRAIDINPVQNPYVTSSGEVLPPKGKRFTDRTRDHPAIIRSGDPVVEAFASIGWGWGGHWSSAKDYQHFSSTGR
jgi:hypothetical protein